MCATEMIHLKRNDTKNVIHLVDIHQPKFNQLYPEINFQNAMKILHGEHKGDILLGLEVTHKAWTLVGKGFWVAPLNWPVFRTVSHWIYLLLAKYRHQISYVLAKFLGIKIEKCQSNTCSKYSSK
jgi:predicted DCC family thiol-disulfide oxidoreductase YuxK